ncbi:MAG: DUF4199 domain-containing protein [Alphaproteobacteria bacterium PA2]|nr:MAG: DUF4199 domain-containing protein [Alphaproteobacteria bacterium PA2]
MLRLILIYGLISGLVIEAATLIGIVAGAENGVSVWLGYLVMLAGLTLVFAGVKRYRDDLPEGRISFLKALGVGLGIAGVANVIYVLGWEIYLAATGYRFIDEYAASLLASHAQDAPAALAKVQAQVDDMRKLYANPVSRMGVTFIEMAPVGVGVSILSAALLRFPKVWPRKQSV